MNRPPAHVYLVGAGPGDPDLITVKGLRALERADAVLYDRLASPRLLAHCRPDALKICVGKVARRRWPDQKSINALLVQLARRGRTVVRLKGGDPFVFGRGAEEVAACRRAGLEVTVVPGVTSATAAPAAAGIPLTHRGIGRSVALVTARAEQPDFSLNYTALAASDTVVVLMGRAPLPAICRGLVEAGRSPATPAATIERATTDRQRWVISRLEQLPGEVEQAGLEAPVVTVIGEVVAQATTGGLSCLAEHPDAGSVSTLATDDDANEARPTGRSSRRRRPAPPATAR